jgi:drug/metabolite transporter (DMT)-like permease
MGELFALVTAVMWAGAVILFARSGEHVPPFALNVFRVTVGAALLLPTLVLSGGSLLRRAPAWDYVVLAASGVIAIAISDTLFHMCLNRVGAGITAIVDCLYSPFVVLLAFLLIGERIRPWQIGGMLLVLASAVVASRLDPPSGRTMRTMLVGILLGVLAMLTLALGIVMAKPVLSRSPVLWATTVRQLGALVALGVAVPLIPGGRAALAVFRPVRSWRFSLSGAFLGSYVALVLWIAGMKYTQAGVAAILNQTSTVFILVLASVFLEEPFTRRKAVSVLLALAGILVVTLC